jgi:hypothetical protein
MKDFIPIEEGDYYLTPEGYRCFTEQYHLKRDTAARAIAGIVPTDLM